MDHSGIAPFAPLPIPPTIYSDIDHMRTEKRKKPPAIPPKMVGAHHNALFDNNNTSGMVVLATTDVCILVNVAVQLLSHESFLT